MSGSNEPSVGWPSSWQTIVDFSKVIVGLGSATIAAIVALLGSDLASRFTSVTEQVLVVVLLMASFAILNASYTIIRYANFAKNREGGRSYESMLGLRRQIRFTTTLSYVFFFLIFAIAFFSGVFYLHDKHLVLKELEPTEQAQFNAVTRRSATPVRRYVWTQLLPETGGTSGGLIVRAIVPPDAACPALGGTERDNDPLAERQNRFPGAFPIKICEAEYHRTDRARLIFEDGTRVSLPRRADPVTDMAVVGDTGCRVTYYGDHQHCLQPFQWPFQDIAAAMRFPRPQVILHVGDYHYRERGCASPLPCGDGHNGYTWDAWERDFFLPAAELLTVAPWIPMRGNHESCSRAGIGWLLFFYPKVGSLGDDDVCQPITDPAVYRLDKDHVFIAADVAETGGAHKPFEQNVKSYKKIAESLQAQPPETQIWLGLHRPIWSRPKPKSDKQDGANVQEGSREQQAQAGDGGQAEGPDQAENPDPADGQEQGDVHNEDGDQDSSQDQAENKDKNHCERLGSIMDYCDVMKQYKESSKVAANAVYVGLQKLLNKGEGAGDVTMILSGDTHLYQLLRPLAGEETDGELPRPRPYQLIAGHGGTALEKKETHLTFDETAGAFTAGYDADWVQGVGGVTFGFASLRRADEGNARQWELDFRDRAGALVVSGCDLYFEKNTSPLECGNSP